MTDVTCSVCGASVGRGPNGFGLISHANKHRREFAEIFDREPRDYQEVRDRLPTDVHPSQTTLWESLTDDEQATVREVIR